MYELQNSRDFFKRARQTRIHWEDEYRGDGLNLYAFCANNLVILFIQIKILFNGDLTIK